MFCVKYYPPSLPNVATIHAEKFLVFGQQSLGMIRTRAHKYSLIFHFHLIFFTWGLHHTGANHIHCHCGEYSVHNLLQFTSTTFSACPVELSGWASDFFVEGRHLSKIRFGRQCNLYRYSVFGRIPVGVKIKVHNVFYTHTSIYSELVLSIDGFKYILQFPWLPYTVI